MAKDIAVTLDGRRTRVPAGSTLLQAAVLAKTPVPTLCIHSLPCLGKPCGICVVEVDGEKELKRACAYSVERPLSVRTYTGTVRRERRRVLSSLLYERQRRCETCSSRSKCELMAMARDYDVPLSSR